MTPASRSIRPLLAVLLVVAAVAAVLRVRTADLDRMLDTDEADYVRAMRYGQHHADGEALGDSGRRTVLMGA